MGEVRQLGAGSGSLLMTVSLYRGVDGEVYATLDHMPVPVIESEETISAQFTTAARWMVDGALSMMRQAVRFDEETRVAQEQDR